MALKDLLAQWPLIQQLQTGARGTGPEAMTQRTRNLRPKTDGAEVARFVRIAEWVVVNLLLRT
jgi:hypothetical protein